MVKASHCVGFTLPGMMEEPFCFAGRLISPKPARRPSEQVEESPKGAGLRSEIAAIGVERERQRLAETDEMGVAAAPVRRIVVFLDQFAEQFGLGSSIDHLVPVSNNLFPVQFDQA